MFHSITQFQINKRRPSPSHPPRRQSSKTSSVRPKATTLAQQRGSTASVVESRSSSEYESLSPSHKAPSSSVDKVARQRVSFSESKQGSGSSFQAHSGKPRVETPTNSTSSVESQRDLKNEDWPASPNPSQTSVDTPRESLEDEDKQYSASSLKARSSDSSIGDNSEDKLLSSASQISEEKAGADNTAKSDRHSQSASTTS